MSIQIVMMLPREALSVSTARHTLAEALELAAVTPDCIHEAQVALSDACTNVFHHMAAGQNLEVLITVGNLDLTMHILESWPGLPSGHQLANWPNGTEQHGRRMAALMTEFTDETVFESQNEGASVRLKKRLRRNAKPGQPPVRRGP